MGPLKGIKIIEISGLGPGPFAGMMLADMGADVIRVERPGGGLFASGSKADFINRNKRCIAVNLKTPEGVETVLRMVERADGIFEGYRPGVAEKLGIGPEVCMARNPKLVFGRMTGWGQEGPWAKTVGHDINYIAVAGALHPIGRVGEKPTVPLTLVGDFGGGGMFLAYGMVCALLEARSSGQGQVVDAAMVDGAATLMTSLFGAQQVGFWSEERGTNMFDSGAPFYDSYETADNKYISVGAVESQFYAQLLEGIGLQHEILPEQMDRSQWPRLKVRFGEIFKTKTRDQWCEIFADKDACVTPVLTMSEVHQHPQIQARQTLIDIEGLSQPAPAPRFSRTQTQMRQPPAKIGQHTDELLTELGYSQEEIESLREKNAVA